jgi:hypothetical protein
MPSSGRACRPVTVSGLAILGRSSLLIMQDRMAEITSELDGDPRMPALFPELHALALAAAGRAADARAVATSLRPLRRDRRWPFLTGVRGLLAIALDDRDRAESAYQALLPFAARPAGADTMLITLWPVAQILGDLARYLAIPGAQAHYKHALAVAEQAHVEPWRHKAP